MQNADGDEVASFETTNGTTTNDQTKLTFSSVAVVNGKLELTFSENEQYLELWINQISVADTRYMMLLLTMAKF